MSTGAPSRSALDMLKWLEPEQLEHDEREFWRYLCTKAECYPWKYIPPLHKPSWSSRIHQLVGAKIDRRNGVDGQPVPTRLWIFGGSDHDSVTNLQGTSAADAFAGALLTAQFRSSFIVFAEGGRVELRLIATQLAGRLLELGFTIDVLMGGSRLKALIIKKGKHRWYLCCWESLSGRPAREVRVYQSLASLTTKTTKNPASVVYAAATAVQDALIRWFGVGLSLTISNTALRAAARSLPADVCKFKPLPLLVSMCRHGGGFRGGLSRGTRYRGPCWLIDMNRAYTAALERPLPWRYCFDRCEKDGVERDGIYVCRIFGKPGLSPIYLSYWKDGEVATEWTNCARAGGLLAVLPRVEASGIRALGYDVRPGFGLVYTRTFSLAAYVCQLRRVVMQFGVTSPLGKLTKLLGNSVYGKFSAEPERRDLRIDQGKPGADWYVFVDETGWPVEDLWERKKTIYQWSQHVDVAAEITARVRGVMYATQATIEASGGRVFGMQTDAIVLDRNPTDLFRIDESEFGAWRLAYADSDGVVAGTNCWSVGEKTVCPDNPYPTRDDILALYNDYEVEVVAQQSGLPRPGRPLSVRVVRRITPPSRAAPAA